MLKYNFLYFSVCPLPLVPAPGSSSLYPPLIRDLHTDENPEPHLLQPEHPQLSQPPLIWQMLQSHNHHLDPSLGLFHYVIVALVLGNPALATALRMGLPSAEQRGRITFPDLLATLVLIHHRIHWLPCCKGTLLAHGQLLVHTSRTLSAKLLPSQLAPILWWCMKILLIYCVMRKIRETCKIALAPHSS